MIDQRETRSSQHTSLILLALDTNKTFFFPLTTFFFLREAEERSI